MTTHLFKIRPLKWESYPNSRDFRAETVFGGVYIEHQPNNDKYKWRYRWCFDEYHDEGAVDCETLDEAKAKAEEFYLSRLMPALTKVHWKHIQNIREQYRR